MYGTCTECLACEYDAVHSTLNSATCVLPISDVHISGFITLYTIVGSHRVYMYVVVHCALLDERIFSEEEAKLQAVFGLHVKDMQLLIEVTVFGLSESITVPFYSRDAAVVVSGVCASESVSKMWMVYCAYA